VPLASAISCTTLSLRQAAARMLLDDATDASIRDRLYMPVLDALASESDLDMVVEWLRIVNSVLVFGTEDEEEEEDSESEADAEPKWDGDNLYMLVSGMTSILGARASFPAHSWIQLRSTIASLMLSAVCAIVAKGEAAADDCEWTVFEPILGTCAVMLALGGQDEANDDLSPLLPLFPPSTSAFLASLSLPAKKAPLAAALGAMADPKDVIVPLMDAESEREQGRGGVRDLVDSRLEEDSYAQTMRLVLHPPAQLPRPESSTFLQNEHLATALSVIAGHALPTDTERDTTLSRMASLALSAHARSPTLSMAYLTSLAKDNAVAFASILHALPAQLTPTIAQAAAKCTNPAVCALVALQLNSAPLSISVRELGVGQYVHVSERDGATLAKVYASSKKLGAVHTLCACLGDSNHASKRVTLLAVAKLVNVETLGLHGACLAASLLTRMCMMLPGGQVWATSLKMMGSLPLPTRWHCVATLCDSVRGVPDSGTVPVVGFSSEDVFGLCRSLISNDASATSDVFGQVVAACVASEVLSSEGCLSQACLTVCLPLVAALTSHTSFVPVPQGTLTAIVEGLVERLNVLPLHPSVDLSACIESHSESVARWYMTRTETLVGSAYDTLLQSALEHPEITPVVLAGVNRCLSMGLDQEPADAMDIARAAVALMADAAAASLRQPLSALLATNALRLSESDLMDHYALPLIEMAKEGIKPVEEGETVQDEDVSMEEESEETDSDDDDVPLEDLSSKYTMRPSTISNLVCTAVEGLSPLSDQDAQVVSVLEECCGIIGSLPASACGEGMARLALARPSLCHILIVSGKAGSVASSLLPLHHQTSALHTLRESASPLSPYPSSTDGVAELTAFWAHTLSPYFAQRLRASSDMDAVGVVALLLETAVRSEGPDGAETPEKERERDNRLKGVASMASTGTLGAAFCSLDTADTLGMARALRLLTSVAESVEGSEDAQDLLRALPGLCKQLSQPKACIEALDASAALARAASGLEGSDVLIGTLYPGLVTQIQYRDGGDKPRASPAVALADVILAAPLHCLRHINDIVDGVEALLAESASRARAGLSLALSLTNAVPQFLAPRLQGLLSALAALHVGGKPWRSKARDASLCAAVEAMLPLHPKGSVPATARVCVMSLASQVPPRVFIPALCRAGREPTTLIRPASCLLLASAALMSAKEVKVSGSAISHLLAMGRSLLDVREKSWRTTAEARGRAAAVDLVQWGQGDEGGAAPGPKRKVGPILVHCKSIVLPKRKSKKKSSWKHYGTVSRGIALMHAVAVLVAVSGDVLAPQLTPCLDIALSALEGHDEEWDTPSSPDPCGVLGDKNMPFYEPPAGVPMGVVPSPWPARDTPVQDRPRVAAIRHTLVMLDAMAQAGVDAFPTVQRGLSALPLVCIPFSCQYVAYKAAAECTATHNVQGTGALDNWRIFHADVLKHASDDSPDVRRRAVMLLTALWTKLGNEWLQLLPLALPVIQETLEDPDSGVQRQAREWCEAIETATGTSIKELTG
ncbi:hypothetical protein KIPB_004059, partial [Kipferlia bialata]